MVTNCSRTHIVLSTTKYFYSYKKRLFPLPFSPIDFKSISVKKTMKQANKYANG